jgi:hypothetical protein
MDYFSQLESIFINLLWGSEEAREAWLSRELILYRGNGLSTFFIEWLNNVPAIMVIICTLVVLLFGWLVFYFFWSWTKAVRDLGNDDKNKWGRK